MAPRRIAYALVVPLVVLAGWQISSMSGWLDPLFFPPPSRLLVHAWELVQNGRLARAVQISLTRLFMGFILGSACGLPLGLLMGAIRPVRYFLEPMVSALYATPKLTLLPMLMVFLGVGDASRITVIAANCFILVAVHALDAVRPIDSSYIDMARNYGAGKVAIFRKVYLPAALPQIFTGLRLALGTGLVMTISVELVAPSDGLGSMILLAWQTFVTEDLFVGVFVAAALGVFFHLGLLRAENYFIPWKRTDDSV